MRIQKSIKILPLIILVALSLLSISGRVRFGLGLGDVVYHGLIYLGLLIYGIFFFITKETPKKRNLIFPIIVIGYCGYLILMMTIWRGVEYRWDGNILASTQKTREKQKQLVFESKLTEFNNQIKVNPNDHDLRVEKGFFLRSNGKYKLAIEEFTEAQKITPDKYIAYWEAGYAYSLMKDYSNAIREYERAYQADTTKDKLKAQIERLKDKYLEESD